jgi:hypothetical protein
MEEPTTSSRSLSSAAQASPISQHTSAAAEIHDRRLARIAEHRSESQADPNAIVAGLGGVNADLFELELLLSQPLLEALCTGVTIEDIKAKTPAINQLVRVAKTSAQISQLMRQFSTPPANPQASTESA